MFLHSWIVVVQFKSITRLMTFHNSHLDLDFVIFPKFDHYLPYSIILLEKSCKILGSPDWYCLILFLREFSK